MASHVAPWWVISLFDSSFRRFFHKPEEILRPYVRQGMKVMDVGCGVGFFSTALGRIVGDEGCVIAVDLQQKMLSVLQKHADKAGVADRIRLHRCAPTLIGVDTEVDFALAFWMVHEVPDTRGFLRQICSSLVSGGKFLVAEPRFHVSLKAFEETLAIVEDLGLRLYERPRIRLSRAAVLLKK